jgi:catechol 2,3-dioxygenase-like lactoylglutathione lyase family enzyme
MKFDHVNIVVQNLEQAIAFYTRVLGLEKTFEIELEGEWIERVTGLPHCRAQCVWLSCAGQQFRLELLQYLTPQGEALQVNSLPYIAGLRHLAFETDELDAVIQRLEEFGTTLISPPVEVPFPVGAPGLRKRLFYFYDPEGVLLEIAEYSGVYHSGD